MTTPLRTDATPATLSGSYTFARPAGRPGFDTRMATASGGAATLSNNVIPGGAVVSAAVGSPGARAHASYADGIAQMNQDLADQQAANQRLWQQQTGGTTNGAVGTSFGSTVGSMNQDLLNQQAANQRALLAQQGGQGTSGLGSSTGGSTTVAGMNSDLVQSQADNAALLKVQIALQHENQVFSSVSNVLKTRHDTVKNSIGNIR